MTNGQGNHLVQVGHYLDSRAPILFLVLDPDGSIRTANRFARKRLGEPLIGERFATRIIDFNGLFDLSAACRDPEARHLIHLPQTDGLPQTYHFNFIASDDAILAFGALDSDELEAMRHQVLHLNQELGNLTRRLHQQNAQLERLNQEKNQFLGMAAHDLRKPIGLILNYAEFLLEETGDLINGEQKAFLNTICRSALFMKRLVDDFLDVSAIEAGHFEMDLQPACAAEALERSLTLTRVQAAKKGVRLNVNRSPDMPWMNIDLPKIEQVVTNLISNAIEHTASGTEVAINLAMEGEDLRFSVIDQGPGIPETVLKRLFQPFVKSGRSKSGGEKSIGLGLVITRKIIEAHGGTITVDSRMGSGTTIVFKIPVTEVQ